MKREQYFLLSLIVLFFLSCVWLTVRQDALLQKGNQDFVSIAFNEPESSKNYDFTVTHKAEFARDLILIYRYENNQEETESFTLQPKEEKLFQPERIPNTITLRYQDADNQTQEISIYKK